MGRVVIKTHTQSKCLIPLKIHNRCLEFDLCISRAQLVFSFNLGSSLVAQLVKNVPAMQETPVRFLGWEYLLEKG